MKCVRVSKSLAERVSKSITMPASQFQNKNSSVIIGVVMRVHSSCSMGLYAKCKMAPAASNIAVVSHDGAVKLARLVSRGSGRVVLTNSGPQTVLICLAAFSYVEAMYCSLSADAAWKMPIISSRHQLQLGFALAGYVKLSGK